MKTLHDYEQQVHAALDELDQATLEQYAEHAADNLDADQLRELALALIMGDSTNLHLALAKIGHLIDRQRADFMEMEAARRSRLADEDELARADLNAELRGAA